jgi:hypothetical protein
MSALVILGVHVMKRLVSVVCFFLLVFVADLALAQAGQLCLFSDPEGTDCGIHDNDPGLMAVYVIHTRAAGATGVRFSAPKPQCMTDAVWLSDQVPFWNRSGDTQTGLTVFYPACLMGQIHVATILYFASGTTMPDCPYEVLPHPASGRIAITNCDDQILDGDGSTTYVNSDLPCTCDLASAPLLFVHPSSLDFGTSVFQSNFTIGNAGGGTLSWTVSPSVPWISVSETSGMGLATITVTVDRGSLPTGSYSGTVEVSSNGGNETVTVTMGVVLEPNLEASPTELYFSSNTSTQIISILNSGGGELRWSISSDQPWMSTNPTSGVQSRVVAVYVDRQGLTPGTYYGNLLVTSNGGSATIPVTMIATATEAVLAVAPPSLSIPAQSSSGAISVRNDGGGTLYWSITSDQPWLSANPASGVNNDQVAVYVDRAGLAPGMYTGHLFVTSNGGSATILVEMFVSDAILIVNPNLLIFTPSTPTSTFSISNGGTGTLEWTLDLFDPWVSASPLSGTGSGVVTVNVDVGSLPCCNMLLGHIRVNSNGGSDVIELKAYPTGPGTGGSIGIYMDFTGTECNLSDATAGMTTYRVVHVTDFGMTACAYWAPKPSCFTATYLSDTNVFPVTIGNSQDGVSIGYGSCRPGPIHVQSIVYFTQGTTPQCCLYPILGIPTSGKVEAVDCANHLITAYGVTSVINPNGACTCGSVRVEESTWGRVKSLYSDE